MKKKFLLISLIAILGVFNRVYAQNNSIKFEHLSIEQGLSQSTVNTILQDSQGFMWFGTIDGLNKFDGYSVSVYHHQPDNPYSIAGNSINILFEDSKGLIWIGTQNRGISIYNRTKDKFYNVSYLRSRNVSPLMLNVKSITEDAEKNIWIGTQKGLFFLNRGTKMVLEFHPNPANKSSISSEQIHKIFNWKSEIWVATNKGLSHFNKKNGNFKNFTLTKDSKSNEIKDVVTDSDNKLWITTNTGLFHVKLLNNKLDIIEHLVVNTKIKNSLRSNNLSSILIDKENLLWVGTENRGLSLYNPKTKKYISYTHDPTFAFSLSVDNVKSLYQDKTGVLWIGTSLGGINKWNKTTQGMDVFRHNPYDSNSLSTSQIRSIYQDAQGVFWIGTVDGGLNRWNENNNTFTHFKHKFGKDNSLSYNHVRAIFEDSRGNFWIGTDGGGLDLMNRKKGTFKHFIHEANNPKSISNDKIYKIFEDRQKQLWIATFGGGINRFNYENQTFTSFQHIANKPQSLSSSYVTCIMQNKNGNYLIGTYGGGIDLWDGKSEEFKHFENNEDNPASIGEDRIYSIFQDSKGRIWIGTKGAGLNRFNPNDESFTKFTEKDGLANNVIMGIIEDAQGYLWLSTNGGLCKFNPKNGTTRNYDVNDGLQSNEFLVGSYFKAHDGKLLFGGVNGLNAFYAKDIKDNPNIPDVLITRFQVFNTDYELDSSIAVKKRIDLKWYQNFVSFDFVALNYIFSEKNQYSYRLIGYDKGWNKVKYRRFANYTNLPPGNYTFQVIGSNNDGIWNKTGQKIQLNIHPAWWQTKIAQYSGIILLILLVYFFVRARIKRIERQKIILEKLVKERTAEVVKQKEEIQEHLTEIEIQRDEIALQQKEITDSIKYAKRIQKAALPGENFSNGTLADSFVLFKPKDIVSGDFYWIGHAKNKMIVVAADCTGHGVPGAFMSMLGISFLNKIVNEKEIHKPHEILNALRDNVIKALHQSHKEEEDQSKDGMDISLCTIDIENNILEYSGANNPLYVFREGEDLIYKPDKMPIAIFDIMDSFSTTTIEMKKGDVFYLFSDGYADQFGGPKAKKLKYKPFRLKLKEIHQKPMIEQHQILDDFFEEWKGELDQIDDVLVMGFRI